MGGLGFAIHGAQQLRVHRTLYDFHSTAVPHLIPTAVWNMVLISIEGYLSTPRLHGRPGPRPVGRFAL